MRVFNFLIFLPALLLFLSCDRQPDQASNELRFINRGDIFTLDLNQMSYMQDFRLTYAIREGLYSPSGPGFSPEPAGALSVEVSDDKTTYTFHLRKESRWSNGDPVTAHDYVFSWRRLLEEPGEYTYLFYPIANAEAYEKAYAAGKPMAAVALGIEAVDDLTLRVKLARPVPYWLELMAFPTFYPRHEKSMEPFKQTDPTTGKTTYRNQYTRPPAVVTNGPFVLKEWEFKKRLRLERNPFYWDKASVKLDAIENIINENVLSQFLQYEAGAVDWISEVPADIAPELREKQRADLQSVTSFGTFFLTLYCKPELPRSVLGGAKNPMADVRVRQALAMSIEKTFVTQQITRMGEAVATTYIPPGTLPGFTSKPGLGYDVAAAQKLLADAGYPGGKGFPKLPILYNTENTTRAKVAQYLKQQWKQNLGIDVEIEGVEGKIFRTKVSGKEYAIATVAWFGDYPDVSTFTDK
jgi:oligopeptide transport system substrate-binding protein